MDQSTHLSRETFVVYTATHVWENLPSVLLAGIVFSLFCAPTAVLCLLGLFVPALIVGVCSIGPAWAALLAREAVLTRGTRTSIGVMFVALRHYWMRGLKLGALVAFPVLAGLLTLPSLGLPEVRPVVWVGLGADAIGFLLGIIILSMYAFPLLVLCDVSARTALRNAIVLSARHVGDTLGLAGMGALIVLATMYLSSGLTLILPAIWGVFAVNHCRVVLQEDACLRDGCASR